MKTLNNIVQEKFMITSKTSKYRYFPKNNDDLDKVFEEKLNQDGYGTEEYPLILRDIDFSKLNNLQNAFNYLDIVYLDISNCNIEHITNFSGCFQGCKKLKKIIGFDTWKLNKHKSYDLSYMFYRCTSLEEIEGIENIKYNDIEYDTTDMFTSCPVLKKPSWYSEDF